MERPLEKSTDKKLNKEIKNIAEALKNDIKKESKIENKEVKEEKKEEKSEVKSDAAKPVESQPAQEKQAKEKQKLKKEEAIARGLNLRASKKHCMYICSFIKNKPLDQAIKELQEVIKMKRAIPFKGEIPHRKGKMLSGRYPTNASSQFIYLLKGLKGNAMANGLDLDKTRIYEALANWASRPQRRGGVRSKRTNVLLKVKEITMAEAKK